MDQAPDLLIFKKRVEAAQKEQAAEVAPKQEPAPQPKQEAKPVPRQESRPQPQQRTEPKPLFAPKPVQEAPEPQRIAPPSESEIEGVKTHLTVSESLSLARGQFCLNHPWRHAYAVCNICRLAYCYVDIMEQDGRLYCLNDIDLATKSKEAEKQNPEINTFSIMASVIFIGNSILLAYYTYPQAEYITSAAIASGSIKFLLHLNTQYYIPIANAFIIFFGLIAAITILRRPLYGLMLALTVSIGGVSAILYEYLNSSVPYLFVSTVMLTLCLAAIVYSRMSSLREVSEEKVIAPDVDWPKPETF